VPLFAVPIYQGGISGPGIGFALADANPDGAGVSSYAIASWTSTWVESAGYNGRIGAWLAARGTFGSAVSAGPRANGPCFRIGGIANCAGNTFAGGALTAHLVNIPVNDVLTVFAARLFCRTRSRNRDPPWRHSYRNEPVAYRSTRKLGTRDRGPGRCRLDPPPLNRRK
jgi:hypothetical protein